MKKLLRILLVSISGYLIVRAAYQFYLLPNNEFWSEKYRGYWYLMLVGWGILFAVLIAAVLLALARPELYRRVAQAAIRQRGRLGLGRLPIALVFLGLPTYLLLYITPGQVLSDYSLRLFLGLSACLISAALLTQSETELVQTERVFLSILLCAGLYVIGDYLSFVTSYPFSLSWSEGNRFYDYSVILGSYRYDYPGKLTIPYNAPGRYLLWGILFAIHNTPIWLHRLWDALLWTATPLCFGWLVARWGRLSALQTACLSIWIFLFLYQGPIYPPLVLSAILVVVLVRQDHLLVSLAGAALAGYYASSSRWTWAPAPAIWAVMILVSGLEHKQGRDWKATARQLLPAALVGVVGLAAGYLGKSDFFNLEEISTSTTLDQPLLWYRLFPNATYAAGIFLGLVVAAAPLLAWMGWALASGWWKVSRLQGLTYGLASLSTLAVGLVVSVKIGGGSNLHNLDMFLVTLALLAGIMLKQRGEIAWRGLPAAIQALVGLTLVLPAAGAIRYGGPLRLPPAEKVNEALSAIRAEAAKAAASGEVLFMDQRQLLTFGYVQGVPLVADYEKKYDMDMAMGNNQQYFDAFYADLRKGRFKLIISDPLRLPKKTQQESFGDENNAWVEWVARPVLCYYTPIATFQDVRVQLLVPRGNPVDCP